MPGAGPGRREISREPPRSPCPAPPRPGSPPGTPAGARCGDVRAGESRSARVQVQWAEEEGIRKSCGYSSALKFGTAGTTVLYGLSPQMDTRFLLLSRVSLSCPTFPGSDAVGVARCRVAGSGVRKQKRGVDRQKQKQRDRDLLLSTLRGPAATGTPVVYLAKFQTNHKHLFIGKPKQNKTLGTHKKVYFTEISYWFM